MADIDEKFDIIENDEERFAFALASRVIHKPKLSIWMIFIPVIFVYFFFQLNKYKQGREEFTHHYLVTRKRALHAARFAVTADAAPDIEEVVKLAELPPETLDTYRELLAVLIQHYSDLLEGKGENITELVRSAYRTRTDYLLFCNRLNQVEKELNTALRPHMKDSVEGFDDVVRNIEAASMELRRQDVCNIFIS
jgi:hypothetical protein